jgi:hypothetical protein
MVLARIMSIIGFGDRNGDKKKIPQKSTLLDNNLVRILWLSSGIRR